VGTTCNTGALFAEDLLNASCTLGDKVVIKDFKDYPANTIGRGHAMAGFLTGKNNLGVDRNYMMLVWSRDSGRDDGGISFWNWDQPADFKTPPTLKYRGLAPQLREAHSTPVTNMFANGDWRTWVFQAVPGFSVYNLDSVAAPQLVTTYNIAGTAKGGAGSAATCTGPCAGSFDAANFDYSNGAVWFTALAAPYLYVAQAANGLNIYRFNDRNNAASISWVRRYDTSWFGHGVNQFWVRGNLGIASSTGSGTRGVTVVDLSNPESLVKRWHYDLSTTPPVRGTYSYTLNGDHLYSATGTGLAVYRIDPVSSALTTLNEVAGGCSSGGYVAAQDGFAHIGLSTCYHKIKREPLPGDPLQSKLTVVTPTSPPLTIGVTGADHDFPTSFGNTVFLGNDHHTTPGSGLFCHQAARDTASPAVNGRNPRNGATGVRVTSGVGLSFTDNLKPWRISKTTLPIRIKGTTAAVDGYYSYQLNTVNFRPAASFQKGTTYEVVVTTGVKDLANNGAVASVGSFTTAN
jgi:hypothetical protein